MHPLLDRHKGCRFLIYRTILHSRAYQQLEDDFTTVAARLPERDCVGGCEDGFQVYLKGELALALIPNRRRIHSSDHDMRRRSNVVVEAKFCAFRRP